MLWVEKKEYCHEFSPTFYTKKSIFPESHLTGNPEKNTFLGEHRYIMYYIEMIIEKLTMKTDKYSIIAYLPSFVLKIELRENQKYNRPKTKKY